MDANLMGKYCETLFKAECMKRGLTVLQPECSHLPFDVVVWTGITFLKVQVKGTGYAHSDARKEKSKLPYYEVPMANARGLYRDQGIDIIAVYVDPMSAWFIVPSSMATSPWFRVYETSIKGGRASACRDRWDYLGADKPATKQLEIFW